MAQFMCLLPNNFRLSFEMSDWARVPPLPELAELSLHMLIIWYIITLFFCQYSDIYRNFRSKHVRYHIMWNHQCNILSLIVPVWSMDAITTGYIRILRLIWWINVSSSSGDSEQKTSWIDSRWWTFWKVSLPYLFRAIYYFRYYINNMSLDKFFFRKPKKKKKKQQLMLEQLNDVEIIKPLKAQEKQNGVHEKQNGWH